MKSLALILIIFSTLTACDAGDGSVSTDTNYDPNAPGGFGMTYNGKLGYDYGNGFVQPLDGSAPSMGFGF